MNNKNETHNQSHLSLSDRFFIEQELLRHSSFRYIAGMLHKDPTTISKEIRRHAYSKVAIKHYRKCKGCLHFKDCKRHHVCGRIQNKNRWWRCIV